MNSKVIASVLVIIIASLKLVISQAPGDHDPECRTGHNAASHVFPAEWRILVDTYDYANLYDESSSGAVWMDVDVDGDSNSGGWQPIGGACAWSMRTCALSDLNSQNNWLISQYISYENAVEVFFNVSYRFSNCASISSCSRPYVTMYRYNRNSANNADRVNTANYQPLFGSEEDSRLQQPSGDNTQQGDTRGITRPTNSNGFYLALRDEGTCGEVQRIIVYYVVCPARQEGLVYYPESSNAVFDAICVANSHNTTSLQVTLSPSTNSNCSFVSEPTCECNEGYALSADGMSCEACSAGTYRSIGDATCQPCPVNTVLDTVATHVCSCVDGFFRSVSQQEGPETACTEPPSACTDLEVTASTATSLTVTWSRPVTTGRSDYFYRVLHSNPSAIGELILAEDNLVNTGSRVSYTITGLFPSTPYLVRVTTHNGVSEQDPDNAHLRQCEVSSSTLEGADTSGSTIITPDTMPTSTLTASASATQVCGPVRNTGAIVGGVMAAVVIIITAIAICTIVIIVFLLRGKRTYYVNKGTTRSEPDIYDVGHAYEEMKEKPKQEEIA